MRGPLLALALLLAAGAGGTGHAQAPPDPIRFRLAEELLEATGGRRSIESTLDALFNGLQNNLVAASQGRLAGGSLTSLADMRQEVVALAPELMAIQTRIYATNFTESELRDYIAFVRSPSGQAVTTKSATLMAQTIEAQRPMLLRAMPGIMSRAMERMCDERACTPEQRAQVAEMLRKMYPDPAPPKP